ncbi:MAG: DUF4870 domain-containing protein [Anaerolineae bacterium]|nr:DUF4870 domain-containing protein [Anaerolineae bacterium]
MNEQSAATDVSSPDEKIMAALGHATIIWPVMGIVAPLIIWATQREKSRFVAFQALQAGVYHMTLIIAGLACGVCYFCSYLGMIVGAIAMPISAALTLPGTGPSGEELPPEALIPILLGFLGMIVFYLAIFGLLFLGLAVWLAYIAYGLYGAVANLQGKDFRYAIIGPRLERYLEGTSAEPGTSP